MVVKMDTTDRTVINTVKRDTLGEIVHGNVHLAAKKTPVGTQTDGVFVPKV